MWRSPNDTAWCFFANIFVIMAAITPPCCPPPCMMYSFVLHEERVTQTRFGMRTSVVALGESGGPDEFIKTSAFTSSGGDAVVVERRRLMGDGRAHVQVRRLCYHHKMR